MINDETDNINANNETKKNLLLLSTKTDELLRSALLSNKACKVVNRDVLATAAADG